LRHPFFGLIAVVFATVAAAVLGYYIANQPTTLRVAVGPVANENVRIVTAAIQTLKREREAFRLRLVLTESTMQSSAALDSGKADLALVRTDISYPRSGATVAVMHIDHVILVAPGGGASSVEELAGKTVALLRDNPGNRSILQIVSQQAGFGESGIQHLTMRPTELKAALEQGKVAAVLVIGPITGRHVTETVNTVAEAGNGDITFIPIPETSAIEQRFPLLEAETIVRGSFGGPKPRPEKDTPTLTVSHQLLAAKTLADATVADFTRVILNAKAQIAADAPLAARMEAPDQEKASPIPIHPGTITYLDGQTTTFLERYGDWFYIGIMGVGLCGSILAAWLGVRGQRARAEIFERLAGLETLVATARNAPDTAALGEVDAEADRLFAYTLQQAAGSNLDAASLAAFNMGLTHVREAAATRRRMLAN
jgi:TRAP transporter TAXI family solute receptor